MDRLLDLKNLRVSFLQGSTWLQVVRGVDLHMERGEVVGLIGESGSGKSVTASSLVRLIDEEVGQIEVDQLCFEGQDLMLMKEEGLRKIRGKRVAYVFQNPTESLSPNMKIGKQFVELFKLHQESTIKEREVREIMKSLLTDVGLSEPELILSRYPHQLSGGQAQRVALAMALALKPDLIVADEPTSSIDASLRGKVMALLKSINETHGIAMLIITHDFEVARSICDRVVVMYGGLVMEDSASAEIFTNPVHPYTRELLACVRSLRSREKTLYTLDGSPMEPAEFSSSCPFAPRCVEVQSQCLEAIPEVTEFQGASVRCHGCKQVEVSLPKDTALGDATENYSKGRVVG